MQTTNVVMPHSNEIQFSNSTSTEMKRSCLCKHNKEELIVCNKTYIDLVTELFFLQHGGNYVDFTQFKKRPSQQLSGYLKQNPIVSNEATKQEKPLSPQCKEKELATITKLKLPISSNDVSRKSDKPFKTKQKVPAANSVGDLFEDIGSQEEILERAKQEAIVQRRVSELRKQGLWSQRRLPKVQEPPRNKAHWDYLLEEMRWLAADFKQERKWKNAAARKLAKMVANFHKDVNERERRAEREEQQKLRRIASTIARQIRGFWCDIEKVIEYKQRCLLDEKRKKALDLHLNFIVDQTAKYSDWLTKGLNQGNESVSPSISRASSSVCSDDDFMPRGASSDDEETIEVEENAEQENEVDEIALLKEESEMPFSELLSQIPSEIIENIGKPLPNTEEASDPSMKSEVTASPDEDGNPSSDEMNKLTPISLRRSARKRHSDDQVEVPVKKTKTVEEADDVEFAAASGSSDDEATIQEEEKDVVVDHQKEIKDLQNEGEMPIEELMKLYSGAFDDVSDTTEATPQQQQEDDASIQSEDDAEDFSASDHDDVTMDYLLKTDLDEKDTSKEQNEENKEIIEVAEQAMSLQPTGHTLATTQVVTPIPSLLRHTLREYQHIGLDWLVTMYEKRLNGILADEMGLGKTIQTIALLAHLACDKGVWGPHLIVVPTSVMLNWEMELKKWCPGFKILTYYGSQKERKIKRTGWTKSNAFHVCITSYKLVIQDHSSFRRKKWRYLILDEAQNIKNFKSQRWQTLLNFNSQRRLLLTGTPLQNNLMELWSLMHFLMPHVFQSHKEFKEWFSNPMSGMIEGSQEFNEKLIRRLHKVLRPFLLRRVKKDVEKQMPNKFEHVVRCHLSKRQRFLYEDFMSRAATKDALSGGRFMSVINVLMQLRKVCNHPNLFEPRPIVSPFMTPPIVCRIPCLVYKATEKDPFQDLDLKSHNLHLLTLSRMTSHELEALRRCKTPSKLITEIDSRSDDVIVSKPNVGEKIRSLIRDRLETQMMSTSIIQTSSKINSGGTPTAHSLSTADGNPTHTTNSDFTPSTQSITLQYQTAQGTRWATIPNGHIRQLPGGVVQIVTSNSTQRTSHHSKESDCTTKRQPSETYTKLLVRHKSQRRQDVLSRISSINDTRCSVTSSYLSADTVKHLHITRSTSNRASSVQQSLHDNLLLGLETSSMERLKGMKESLERFVFVIPKVACSTPKMVVSHPTPWRYYSLSKLKNSVRKWLSRQLLPFHNILENSKVSFPETCLIQYDCGKLQVLSVLLRRFWSEKHRILIFTQMTRVLDILEAFLSHHGYKYLRLDGSTPIEQRMSRMERFNNDPRIFCFILSTRSGGIGVNLTGADTVVFYDSDWNPTMDAQAQDRCHRIGQTRDVHIYRLISENTVEENILKKANQKRLLGDIAIEGGSFTTAFFKQQQIKDLFDDPSGLEELVEQPRQLTARQRALEAAKSQPKELEHSFPTIEDEDSRQKLPEAAKLQPEKEDQKNLEQALLDTEEKEDAAAAAMLKEEQEAMMEEFQDTEDRAPNEEMKLKLPKGSKVEEELRSIYDELTPVERYALQYLEESAEAINDMELQQAEEQVEQSKKEWELAHLVALKEQEERRTEEDDEIFYTREGNQMFEDISRGAMPMWLPPTPPQDEVYIDPSIGFLYDSVPMSDINLANVMMKSERKRPKLEATQGPRRKVSRLDIKVPKSIFYHPIMTKKKDRQPKQKVAKQPKPLSSLPSTRMVPPGGDVSPGDVGDVSGSGKPAGASPDWIVNEDWSLLQAVQQVLEMPLSLVTMMPAHTPNWHLVADVVNAVGCVYRSPKDCKLRFESVLVPREEGKIDAGTPKKKIKNIKFPIKAKLAKTSKMLLAHSSDDNLQFSTLYSRRFDACHLICSKRNPPKNSAGSGQFQRNPKHAAVLNECGIIYDKPLHPMQIAATRVKRLASQKKSAGDQVGSIQPPHQATTTSNLPPGVTISQHIGGTLVVNGSPIVGKQPTLQVASSGVSQLTAIPLSGGAGSIVVNSAFARRQPQLQLQASTTKLPQGKTGAALALRTLPGNTSQLQLQQPITCVQSMSLTFTSQSPMVTITSSTEVSSATSARPVVTYPVRGGKMTGLQHVRHNKLQPSSTPTKQQMKPVRVSQPQLASSSALMSVASSVFGKKLQLGNLPKMTRTVTHQELEMLVKQQRSQIKTVQHRPAQVHIAPIQGQLQSQQGRPHTQPSTKSLPITVPVTNLVSAVNLGNLTSSSQQKQMIPGQQTTLTNPQFIVQQHFMKQRQQQQSRQAGSSKQTPQKTMYATVPSHQLVVSGGGTTVKMTPQIQAQMISQLVAQQKQQRRLSNKGTSQPSISGLTVTKVLQSSSPSAARHTLVPQTAQVTPLPLSGATTIVTPTGVAPHQQRMASQQRQQMQASRVGPVAIGQSLNATSSTIVASTPVIMQRPPVVVGTTQVPQQVHIRNPSPATPQPALLIGGNPPTSVAVMTSTENRNSQSRTR